MKSIYTAPELNIIEFETEDIITTSNPDVECSSDGNITFPIIPLK